MFLLVSRLIGKPALAVRLALSIECPSVPFDLSPAMPALLIGVPPTLPTLPSPRVHAIRNSWLEKSAITSLCPGGACIRLLSSEPIRPGLLPLGGLGSPGVRQSGSVTRPVTVPPPVRGTTHPS